MIPRMLLQSVFLLLALGLTACDKNRHFRDLQNQIEDLKKSGLVAVPSAQTPLNEPKPATYKASNLRQPFTLGETVAPTKNASSSDPLRSYSLNMLRFVGTLTDNGVPAAYILTPDNRIYPVKVGDTIGDRRGKIKSIYTDHIEITEPEISDSSQLTERLVTLQLKE